MRTLHECIKDLLRAFARTRHPTEVMLIELGPADFGTKPGPTVRRRLLKTPEEYNERFEELLHAGYGWINLSLYGELDDQLLVAVELPRKEIGVSITPVNISGPRRDVEEAGGDVRVAIRFIDDEVP